MERLKGFQHSKFIGESRVKKVLEAYETSGRSCLKTSLRPEVYCSQATVNRIVRKAVEMGVVPNDFARGPGRPVADRGRIKELLEDHPQANDKQIAPLAGVSSYTVARVRREGE